MAIKVQNTIVIDDTRAISNISPLSIEYGGTGQNTASGAINALLPSQSANTGKFLTTDGTGLSWEEAGGTVSNEGSIINSIAFGG